MKKISVIAFPLIFGICSVGLSQNVGVGNTNPQERLDVAGNINLDGTIKIKGVDGTAGQALMKNSAGTMVWGDLSQYKNIMGFPAGVYPLSNTVYVWTVPASVKKLLVEAWGGGGGGSVAGGGGGGGYAVTEWGVTPGSTVNITVGAAGAGAASAILNGVNGNNTVVTINSIQLTAEGGGGAVTSRGGQPGRFSVSSTSLYSYGQSGNQGESTTETYGQYNATVYYTATRYGSGGQAGNTAFVNNNGGFRSFNTSNNATIKLVGAGIGTEPGGGGGGENNGGRYGGPGLVIIHY